MRTTEIWYSLQPLDEGALAVGELVSRTDKDSNASTDEDSNELHKTPLIEITVAIRNTAEL